MATPFYAKGNMTITASGFAFTEKQPRYLHIQTEDGNRIVAQMDEHGTLSEPLKLPNGLHWMAVSDKPVLSDMEWNGVKLQQIPPLKITP